MSSFRPKNIKVSGGIRLFFDDLIEIFNVQDKGKIPAKTIIQSFSQFISQLQVSDAQDAAKVKSLKLETSVFN